MSRLLKAAAAAAVQDWEGALEELNKLKDAIDSNTFVPVLEQLQQRSWLMHWGLYIFFNHENGRNLIIDYLFQDRCALPAATANLQLRSWHSKPSVRQKWLSACDGFFGLKLMRMRCVWQPAALPT